MADLAELQEMNAVFETYFGLDSSPARTTFQAGGLIAGANFEIDLVVIIP
jgi:enamine deaminase RidA (YjgF/YER057c/UK114 family)